MLPVGAALLVETLHPRIPYVIVAPTMELPRSGDVAKMASAYGKWKAERDSHLAASWRIRAARGPGGRGASAWQGRPAVHRAVGRRGLPDVADGQRRERCCRLSMAGLRAST